MLPVEGSGLDTDSRGGDTLHSHWTVVGLDPFSGGWAIGQEKEETDAENHGDRAQDVKDEFPSSYGRVAEWSNTSGHQRSLQREPGLW